MISATSDLKFSDTSDDEVMIFAASNTMEFGLGIAESN